MLKIQPAMDYPTLAMLFAWICVRSAASFGGTCSEGCQFSEFQCSNGECLNVRHFCDGIVDCPDGSDEILEDDGCSNAFNEDKLKCKLPNQYECDGIHHCEDKRDESLCNTTYQMQCNKAFCINKLFLNCANRPEWNCPPKILCNEALCSKFKDDRDPTDISQECGTTPIFRCDSGECLDPRKFCDGTPDCADGSDEIIANGTNHGDGIPCSNKWNLFQSKCVLPSRHMCDRIDHCDDRVDECQNGCKNSFFCKNGKCLTKAAQFTCNGHDDCGDSSDECNANCNATFKCNDGTCIAMDEFCDGRVDCADGSDEFQPSQANESQVVCFSKFSARKNKCVLPNHHRCDELRHCSGGEDELDCPHLKWFKCDNNKTVYTMSSVCNFLDDCCDSSDECSLSGGCNKTYICPNNNKCIAFSRFCDGIDDCGDGSDEIVSPLLTGGCSNKYNQHKKSCVLPQQYFCDSLDHCEGRVDECTSNCRSSFFCNDGQCISHTKFCDGVTHCKDKSDEINSQSGFKCHVTNSLTDVSRTCVLPQSFLFDDISDCRANLDDCERNGSCFRCFWETFFISSRQVCDGVMDCPDLSDECFCSKQNKTIETICDNYCLLQDSEDCKKCNKTGVVCDGGDTCISVNNVCDGTEQCKDGTDENACKQEEISTWQTEVGEFNCVPGSYPTKAVQCDGIPQCKFAEDECRKGSDGKFVCGNETLQVCKTSEAKTGNIIIPHCPGKPNDYLSYDICDGKEDCEKPENGDLSADEIGCKNRWRCPKSRPKETGKSTIHMSRVCDSEIDCEEEEDEDEVLCRGKGQPRFYCENRVGDNNRTKLGPLFVSMQQVLDGKKDCWDNSDECPTELFRNNTFSSHHRMIRNMILSVFVWVMGILAVVGNSVVMWHSVMKLRTPNRFFKTMKSNYILVFNLAAADLLMGVYLLGLAMKNANTDGSYCKYDREWRSGSVCSALGSLAMISLQASVCFLVLLTSYRMWVVLKPFNADILKVRYTIAFVVFVWMFSLVLALIPRFENFKDYFVSSAVISPGIQFFDTSAPTKQELERFAKNLILYSNETVPTRDLSWIEIRDTIDSRYPRGWTKMEILMEFGYYSAHSVCLPKIFTKVSDNAWAFSTAIMVFDFFSFVYIVTAYVVIYNDAATRGAATQNRNAAKENKIMQARITRLVLADFFCLVPVCLTAFISVWGVEINPVAYAIAAIVLLPINSALNPIIYSNFPGVLYSSCVTPAQAWATKIMMKRRIRAENRIFQQEQRSSSYKRYKTSITSNESAIQCERMRLSSNGSTSTSNRTASLTLTTSSKL